jgi:formylglycine-generating enzyme required for sulfatase activity
MIAEQRALIGVRFVLASQRRSEFARSLDSVNPGQLMERLQQAEEFGAALDPPLRPQVQRADEVDATAAERRAALPSRLVLVPRDQTQVPVLSEVLLSGELPYVAPIRERLRSYAAELRPQWLQVLRDEQQTVARRFRAALGLAGLDGHTSAVEWTAEDTKFIAEQLSLSFGQDQLQLRELLRPISEQLIPDLDMLFDAEGSTAEQQENVTLALADYAGADGERMARLLTRANQRQTEILYPKVAEYKSGPVREGLLALTREQPDENLGQLDRVRLGRRRANAAIALLRQGERDLYFDALRITDDPESLSQFVSRCKNWGVTAEELVESLGRSRVLRASATGEDRRVEARVMYGLLLALGSYSLEQIAEASREPLIADLKRLYVEDPSAAVHSASGWLLRTWGREADVLKLDEVEVAYDASGVREWFRLRVTVEPLVRSVVVHKGKPQIISLTFILFPVGVYQTGSPEWEEDRQENETVRVVNISQPFALCDREVTWELYDLFGRPPKRKQVSENMGWELGENDAAMTEAVAWEQFCDWLTSFLFGTDEDFQGDDAVETLAEDNRKPLYRKRHLYPGGFRMPTEWEWEVGARSGQQTPWSFGSDVGLLGDYAWYSENSGNRSREVCLKRPTIGGLHDVHGNLLELTDDTNGELDRGIISVGRKPPFRGVLPRGGSWSVDAANCRLANRNGIDSRGRNMGRGFRLALSLPMVSPALEEELSTTPDER